MKRDRPFHRMVLLVAMLLSLAVYVNACSSGTATPKQARSGIWRGETAFGSFSFEVCEGRRNVTAYTLEYTMGEDTRTLTLGVSDKVQIDREDNSFDLSRPEEGVTFRGQFSADGKSATGLWEVAAPGGTVSEAWAIER